MAPGEEEDGLIDSIKGAHRATKIVRGTRVAMWEGMKRIVALLPLSVIACLSQSTKPDPPPNDPLQPGMTTFVTTQHNDNARTGANLRESILTPASFAKKKFRRLFARSIRGYVYAQPLYVPGLTVGGKTRNVVFVATEHNELYAFDADDPSAGDPLWHDNFGPPVISEHLDKYQGTPYRDIIPEVGITSTPVIDLATGTLYVYAQTEENDVFTNDLYAIDILTGAQKMKKRVVVSAKGSAPEQVGGIVTTEQKFLLQRPGLGIDRGILWITGGGHGDFGAYHGWVLAIDEATLETKGTYLTTPDGWAGGIWQSGNGPSIDEEGALYFQTGNGTFAPEPANISNAFGKVALRKDVELVDWFSPFNQDDLNMEDGDLGSSGPLLIPGTKLLVGGGKEGKLYLIDRNNFGHFRSTDDNQILQSFQSTYGNANKHIHAGPVWWDSQEKGPRIYILSESDAIRSYLFDRSTQRFVTSPLAVSDLVMPPGTPGGAMSLSANGSTGGVLWALTQSDNNASGYITGHGALHALDAETLHDLYSSIDEVRFDYVKFSCPTIAGGKAFVGTASNELLVFGLEP